MLAWCGGNGDGAKGRGFPGIHADHVAKAYLTRCLFGSTYDGDGHLFVRVRLEGFHIVVVVVIMTDGDSIQSRQSLQGDAVGFAVIVAISLRKPGISQHPVAVEVDEHTGVCNASNGQCTHVCTPSCDFS